MKNKRQARTGFTLVELLVVIAIIGILMALLLPAVQKIRGRGPVVKCQTQIGQLAAACAQFKADFGIYPPDNAVDAQNAIKAMYPRYTGAMPAFPATPNGLLVYFLGGPSGTGWAIDAPVAPGPTATTKKGPYFEFQTVGAVLDPWETPLQYRASTTGGGYSLAIPPGGVAAYYESNNPAKFVNTGSVQIISAGPNKQFGPGGSSWPQPGQPGADDLANFNGGFQLSSPQ